MLTFALNHMTVPRLGHEALFRLATSLGCAGVELRNDLERPPSDRGDPEAVRRAAEEQGLRIVGVSQIYPFQDRSEEKRGSVATLIEQAVALIEDIGAAGRVKLVHDTFHHHLAGETAFCPEHAGIVHVSGITDPEPAADEMRDDHRVLVDDHDRLGNVAQLKELTARSYDGVVSIEAFSPEIHALAEPEPALRETTDFLSARAG